MAEHKYGLHKEVSAIFGGIPIPSVKISQHKDSPAQGKVHNAGISIDKKLFTIPKINPSVVNLLKSIVDSIFSNHRNIRQTAENYYNFLRNKILEAKNTNDVRQKTMFGLILLFSLILAFNLFKGSAGLEKAKDNYSVSADLSKTFVEPEIKWHIPAKYPVGLRDPMKANTISSAAGKGGANGLYEITIKGIVYSEDNPAVIIGGQIFQEGEKIAGTTILKINEGSVRLEKGGKTWIQKVQ